MCPLAHIFFLPHNVGVSTYACMPQPYMRVVRVCVAVAYVGRARCLILFQRMHSCVMYVIIYNGGGGGGGAAHTRKDLNIHQSTLLRIYCFPAFINYRKLFLWYLKISFLFHEFDTNGARTFIVCVCGGSLMCALGFIYVCTIYGIFTKYYIQKHFKKS